MPDILLHQVGRLAILLAELVSLELQGDAAAEDDHEDGVGASADGHHQGDHRACGRGKWNSPSRLHPASAAHANVQLLYKGDEGSPPSVLDTH